MAKLILCSVFDVKAAFFGVPFTCKSRGEAVRTFTDACLDDQVPFKRHPDDYRLFVVGEFDDQLGQLWPLSQPDFVIGARDVLDLTYPRSSGSVAGASGNGGLVDSAAAPHSEEPPVSRRL